LVLRGRDVDPTTLALGGYTATSRVAVEKAVTGRTRITVSEAYAVFATCDAAFRQRGAHAIWKARVGIGNHAEALLSTAPLAFRIRLQAEPGGIALDRVAELRGAAGLVGLPLALPTANHRELLMVARARQCAR